MLSDDYHRMIKLGRTHTAFLLLGLTENYEIVELLGVNLSVLLRFLSNQREFGYFYLCSIWFLGKLKNLKENEVLVPLNRT